MKIPILKSCCFCLPLKKGLLITGYLKLVSSISLMLFSASTYGLSVDTLISLGIVFVLNALFDIAIIIAGYKENMKLYKVCYYYGIIFWFILAIILVATLGNTYLQLAEFCYSMPFVFLIEITPVNGYDWIVPTSNLIFQTYFLLLIRSVMIRLDNASESGPENEKNTAVTDV